MYITVAQSTIKKDMIQLQINQRITNNIIVRIIKQKAARFSLFSITPPPPQKKGATNMQLKMTRTHNF